MSHSGFKWVVNPCNPFKSCKDGYMGKTTLLDWVYFSWHAKFSLLQLLMAR